MRFKSHIQPRCRFCGKSIAKHTTTVTLTKERTEYQKDQPWNRYIVVPEFPKTKLECQALTNEKITAVKRTRKYKNFGDDVPSEDYVSEFSVWDGETYRDQFFCNRTQCAVSYAYMVVEKSNLVSKAYNEAMQKDLQRQERWGQQAAASQPAHRSQR